MWLQTLLLSSLFAAVAHAQPQEAQLEAARLRGREAIERMQREDFAGAERALSEALALHPAPTLFQLRALARERLGHLLAAATDDQAAVEFPANATEHAKYAQARSDAQTHLAQLLNVIPRLTLSARGRLVRVTVNTVDWPVDALPLSRSLDPGTYTVEAVDAEGTSRNYQVELKQRSHQSIVLEGTRTASVEADTPAYVKPSAAAPLDEGASPGTARYILGAATLALTAGAIATGIYALERRADYHEHNRADVAMAEKLQLRQSATTWGWVSTGLGAAALAGAASFLYVCYVAPSAPKAPGGLQLVAAGTF